VLAGADASSSLMHAYQPRHLLIHKPIIFGTYAIFRGKKVLQEQLYAWCCYVRGQDGEDISRFVSKVEFELDPSFPQPIITVTQHPFQIHEVGWGQFPINIKLYFHDPNCKPVETVKDLVLFDDMNPTTKRPIVTEEYNELVFVDPSPSLLRLLQSSQSQAKPAAHEPPHAASRRAETGSENAAI